MPKADTDAPGDTYSAALGINYLNNIAFWSNPGTSYSLGTVPFTAEMHRKLQEIGSILTPIAQLQRFAPEQRPIGHWGRRSHSRRPATMRA